MRQLLRHTKIAGSGLSTVLGLFLFFLPGMSARLLARVIGGCLLAYGGIQIIGYLKAKTSAVHDQLSILVNGAIALVGAWIIARPSQVLSIIPFAVGAFLLIHGVWDLRRALDLRAVNDRGWTLAMLIAGATAITGLLLVVNPFSGVTTAFRFIGLFLLLDAISDLWIVHRIKDIL